MVRTSVVAISALVSGTLAGCAPTPGASAPLAVRPVCTVETMVSDTFYTAWNGRVFTADRADPTVGGGFTPFGPLTGPRSNPLIRYTNASGVPDCYGISEAWLRVPGFHQVHRAMLVPAIRPSDGGGTFGGTGARWLFAFEDTRGAWVREAGEGGSHLKEDEPFDPVVSMDYLPAMMVVGDNDPRVFACGPGRSEDNAVVTTVLTESRHPTANPDSAPFLSQDAIIGDSRFVPNAPGPLIGPSKPPTPTLPAVGAPITEGFVTCAMTQSGDDVATRTLHLLKKDGHHVWHATRSDYGPVTTESGGTYSRFRSVTPWTDIAVGSGMDFGEIADLATVGRGANLSVVLLGKSNDRYKLWHLVRFGSGSWRAPEDVFVLNGDAPLGWPYSFRIAVGACPEPGVDANGDPRAELLIALQGGSDGGIYTVSVVQSLRAWAAGRKPSVYSPLSRIRDGDLVPANSVGNPRFIIRGVRVNARPFPETRTPPPSTSATP